MTRVSPLFGFMPYGAPELLDAGRPNMARALVVASTLGALVFALMGLLALVHPAVVSVPVMPHVDIIPPPPPEIAILEPIHDPGLVPPAPPPNSGSTIDDVVPDALVKQSEPSFAPPDVTSAWGPPSDVHGGEVVLDGRATPETLPDRGTFTSIEVMPEALREVKPIYPEMAKDLGISGLVLVHMLVGRDGRVLNAVVDEKKNDAMFNDAALAAARQWVFRPGANNGHTVAAWVTIPFKFTFIPN